MKSSLRTDFSVLSLCPLWLGGEFLLGNKPPQRHRGHRDSTEKLVLITFRAKPVGLLDF